MKTVRLLVDASVADEYVDPMPVYAIVTIDEDCLKYLKDKTQLAEKLHQEDRSFFSIEYFDAVCDWYEDLDIEDLTLDDSKGFAVLPDDFIPDEDKVRMNLRTIVFYNSGTFTEVAYIEHADVRCDFSSIAVSDIEELFK